MSAGPPPAPSTRSTFFPNTLGEHKMTNLFTVGGKLGYAWDRWMIYARAVGPRPT